MATTELYQGLTFLSYSTGIIVILIGIMLIKVLFDISALTKNINETTSIIKTEIEPTLKNINKSVEIVSGIIIKADENVQRVKSFLAKTPLKLIGQASKLSGKAAKGFFSGLYNAFKLFSKK